MSQQQSDLRKMILKKRTTEMAPLSIAAPWASNPLNEQDEDDLDLDFDQPHQVLPATVGAPASADNAGFAVPAPRRTTGRGRRGHSQQYEALPWSDFFDSRESVAGFTVYRTGPGLCPSTTTINATTTAAAATSAPTTDSSAVLLLMLHGAGLSALSWAHLARLMKAHCDIAAFDMRGHGESIDCGADEVDWSTDRLCADAVTVLRQLMTTTTSETKPRPAPASASASAYDDQTTAVEPRRYQRVVIVGHSMGGAIAARVAHAVPKEWLGGLVLIDVVEGTALEALPAMQRVISNRPTSFPDIATAIRWAKANHISSNLISARVSLPSQLRSTSSSPSVEPQQQQQHDHHGSTSFVWKVALKNTEPFWRDWFTGLSACFLGAQCPKLLLLAGTDRLDKALMIGQMQGKFQLELLPQAGHAVQEDEPEATAAKLLQFLQRHRLYQR